MRRVERTPASAAADINRTAELFAQGDVDVLAMWDSFHRNLYDLCRDEPLSGHFLNMFEALEAWELSVGPGRSDAEEVAREVARLLAQSA